MVKLFLLISVMTFNCYGMDADGTYLDEKSTLAKNSKAEPMRKETEDRIKELYIKADNVSPLGGFQSPPPCVKNFTQAKAEIFLELCQEKMSERGQSLKKSEECIPDCIDAALNAVENEKTK